MGHLRWMFAIAFLVVIVSNGIMCAKSKSGVNIHSTPIEGHSAISKSSTEMNSNSTTHDNESSAINISDGSESKSDGSKSKSNGSKSKSDGSKSKSHGSKSKSNGSKSKSEGSKSKSDGSKSKSHGSKSKSHGSRSKSNGSSSKSHGSSSKSHGSSSKSHGSSSKSSSSSSKSVPLEPTCCCSVRGDPLIEGFDSMAVSIDVNQGDRCWMADTFNSQQNPDICRYRVAARFGPNKTPNRIIVSFLTADTGLTYQFKIPEPNAGNPALSYVTTTHIGNTWTLTADDPSCQFIISLDVSAEEGSICMQSPDANLETAHQGLCGNCNGKFDDYYLRNGTNVTHASDKFVQMKDSFCWT